MRKPETSFYTSIHRLLPKNIYYEKMSNPYRSGTPDVWYSGQKRDLWVEYKYEKYPIRTTEINLSLSELQKKWLLDRHKEGRHVAVICGTDKFHAFFLRDLWREPAKLEYFTMTKHDLANCLIHFLNEASDELVQGLDYRKHNI